MLIGQAPQFIVDSAMIKYCNHTILSGGRFQFVKVEVILRLYLKPTLYQAFQGALVCTCNIQVPYCKRF